MPSRGTCASRGRRCATARTSCPMSLTSCPTSRSSCPTSRSSCPTPRVSCPKRRTTSKTNPIKSGSLGCNWKLQRRLEFRLREDSPASRSPRLSGSGPPIASLALRDRAEQILHAKRCRSRRHRARRRFSAECERRKCALPPRSGRFSRGRAVHAYPAAIARSPLATPVGQAIPEAGKREQGQAGETGGNRR